MGFLSPSAGRMSRENYLVVLIRRRRRLGRQDRYRYRRCRRQLQRGWCRQVRRVRRQLRRVLQQLLWSR